MTGDLGRRVAFAAVAIPVVLGLAWIGSWAFAALLGLAGALGAREIYALARAQGNQPLARFGIASAALVPFVGRLGQVAGGEAPAWSPAAYLFAVWLLAALVLALARREPAQRPLAAAAITVLGVLYAAWLPSFALQLRHPLPGPGPGDRAVGMALLAYPLAVTWIGDSFAMAAGRSFAGPRLAPVVSPNKTWSGSAAGLFAAVAVSLVYAALVLRRVGVSLSALEAVVGGAALGVAAQVGDLVESLFKREVGRKDSSSLIPGHGGVLDRLDSLYFVLPVTVVLMRLADLS